MDTHTHGITVKHLAKYAINSMVQAISPPYEGSPKLKGSSTEHPETAEDNPAPVLTDTTDPLADQAADTLNTDKDQNATEEAPYRYYNQDRIHISTLQAQMLKENINHVHKLTPETDDEYPVFTDDANYNSDNSFTYFGANDDPGGYMDYELGTKCSLYDTNKDHHTTTDNNQLVSTKPIPGPSTKISLNASCIPRPHTSKYSLEEHHAIKTLQDINNSRSNQPTRTTKKSNITEISHISVSRTSANNKYFNIPGPGNPKKMPKYHLSQDHL